MNHRLLTTATTRRKPNRAKPARPISKTVRATEVLTLKEVAEYLRLSPEEVVRLVTDAGLPGRKTSSDWRFLKAAVQEWLTQPERTLVNAALLELAGQFAKDPFLDDITATAYKQRKRSASGTAG